MSTQTGQYPFLGNGLTRYPFLESVSPDERGDDAADDRGDDEEPELCQGIAADKYRRSQAPGGIYGRAGYRYADKMYQHQSEADGQAGKSFRSVPVSRAEDDKKEYGSEHHLGDNTG